MMSAMRKVFASGRTLPYEWRMTQLRAMVDMLEKEEPRLLEALWKDLRKVRHFWTCFRN